MIIASHKVTFKGVLFLFGVIYISVSFFTGETFFEMPNNWFVTWMASVFQQMDGVGFFNVWSGQSHGFNYLYFILWKPAQALAGGQYYFGLVFTLLWGLLSIGSLFLSAYLLYKIVEHLWGEEKGVLLGTVYLLFFLTMPRWYEVIDSITIAGLLGAVYLSLKGHTRWGGVLLGITATLKPIGLVILPVLIKSEFLSRKARIWLVLTSVGSFILLILPFALGNFKIFMSSLNWQSGRPPWQSVYAFFMWVFHKPYPLNPFFQDASGASVHDWGLTGITPSTSIMTTPVPAFNTWYNGLFYLLTAAAMLAFLLFKRVRAKDEVSLGALCMLGAYFGFFYGWSPQFVFWLVPFMLISLPLVISVTFRLLVMLEYPFFYGIYIARIAPDMVGAAPGLTVAMTSALAPIGAPGYWALVIVRTLLILTFAVMSWIKLPTRLWNPVPAILRYWTNKQSLQLKTLES